MYGTVQDIVEQDLLSFQNDNIKGVEVQVLARNEHFLTNYNFCLAGSIISKFGGSKP